MYWQEKSFLQDSFIRGKGLIEVAKVFGQELESRQSDLNLVITEKEMKV